MSSPGDSPNRNLPDLPPYPPSDASSPAKSVASSVPASSKPVSVTQSPVLQAKIPDGLPANVPLRTGQENAKGTNVDYNIASSWMRSSEWIKIRTRTLLANFKTFRVLSYLH